MNRINLTTIPRYHSNQSFKKKKTDVIKNDTREQIHQVVMATGERGLKFMYLESKSIF